MYMIITAWPLFLGRIVNKLFFSEKKTFKGHYITNWCLHTSVTIVTQNVDAGRSRQATNPTGRGTEDTTGQDRDI